MKEPNSLSIQSFLDARGKIEFCNEFDLLGFKRFYIISPDHKFQIRAWQGHKFEEKAFLVLSGSIKLVLVPMVDFELGLAKDPIEFILDENDPKIISVPGGYLNGFQFLTSNSKLMVFSSMSLDDSKNDDFRYDFRNYFEW